MRLEKYSFGIGDRFGQQGLAQLKALIDARKNGLEVVPVWNKSNREHQIIGSLPENTCREAEAAVKELNWDASYYVDADHINLKTVGPFLDHANFFTLDVADYLGTGVSERELQDFLKVAQPFQGILTIPGIAKPFEVTGTMLTEITGKFLGAIREASAIYDHIVAKKGAGSFIAEVSMDEVENAQSPVELFFILLMINHYGIPAQTIAPKFTGRFNKGVDYSGNPDHFRREFEEDLLVIKHAVRTFGLPDNLKLSIHSGSDKFSIYPIMGELIRKYDSGIHVKTAGTTWLEEVIGLAMSGGKATQMAIEIYCAAYDRQTELCEPYASVIDIDSSSLPAPDDVRKWDGKRFADTLRHIPGNPYYHSGFRQLIHVGYKLAAELGGAYLAMIRKHHLVVGEQVRTNIYERHLQRLF